MGGSKASVMWHSLGGPAGLLLAYLHSLQIECVCVLCEKEHTISVETGESVDQPIPAFLFILKITVSCKRTATNNYSITIKFCLFTLLLKK